MEPGRMAEVFEALTQQDSETLCAWWCQVNVYKWPEPPFPVPKPEGWDDWTHVHQYECEMARLVEDMLHMLTTRKARLEYWNKHYVAPDMKGLTNDAG